MSSMSWIWFRCSNHYRPEHQRLINKVYFKKFLIDLLLTMKRSWPTVCILFYPGGCSKNTIKILWENIYPTEKPILTLLWRRPLLYRKQSIGFQSESMDWFLYNRELRHERVKEETHSELCDFLPLTISTKNSVLDVWQGSDYAFVKN